MQISAVLAQLGARHATAEAPWEGQFCRHRASSPGPGDCGLEASEGKADPDSSAWQADFAAAGAV